MEKCRGSTKNKLISNQRGQFAIEAVLLMTVLIGVTLMITKYLKGPPSMVQKLVSEPVAQRMGAMIGFGTWNPNGCTAPGKPAQTIGKCHPNSIHRSLSSAPGD